MSFMTRLPDVHDRDDLHDGMAFFANTGPAGQTCGTCVHRSYWRTKTKVNHQGRIVEEKQVHSTGCQMFLKLSGRHGPRVNKDWHACKYFEIKTGD